MSVIAPPPQDELELLIRDARARQRRRWLVGATLVAALAGVSIGMSALLGSGTRKSTQASNPRPAISEQCQANQLSVSLVRSGAVLGEEGGLLRFANVSGTTCRLAGWPRVVAVEPNGRTAAEQRDAGGTMLFGWNGLARRRLPILTLQRGDSAYAIIAAGDNPVRKETSCPRARHLRIAPPGSRRFWTISAWLPNDGHDFLPCSNEFLLSPVLPLRAIFH